LLKNDWLDVGGVRESIRLICEESSTSILGIEQVSVVAYILVTLKSGAERDVCKKVSGFEEVVQLDELYGEYDAIIKIRLDDLSHLDTFLTEKLRVLPDIFLTTTMIVAKEYQNKTSFSFA
jgi:DNA-binding Lrp family transcriptional regulator